MKELKNDCSDVQAARKFSLGFPSDPKFMSAVRQFVSRISAMAGFDKNGSYAVTLAVDEACTNIIKYSYDCDLSKRIEITVELLERGIQFDIVDFGAKCDGSVFESRELDQVAPGGLGVYLITKIMDQVIYNPSAGDSTTLTLVKFLPDKEGEEDGCNS